MARILTKAQLGKLESKSRDELQAIVLDLAQHVPLAKKHLINQYLTAEEALLALAQKEYKKFTRRLPSWDYQEVDAFFATLCEQFIPLLAKGIATSPREGEVVALALLGKAGELYEKMDTSSGSWEDYHLALVEQWLMAICAQCKSVLPEVLARRLREGLSSIDPAISITHLFEYRDMLGTPLVRALRDDYAAVGQLPEALGLSLVLRDIAFFDQVQQVGGFTHPRQQIDYARLLIDELRAEQAIAVLQTMKPEALQRHRQLTAWHQVLIQAFLEEGRRGEAHVQALSAFAATQDSAFFSSYCQSGEGSKEEALARFVAIAEQWGHCGVLMLLDEVEAWPQLAQRIASYPDTALLEVLSILTGSTVRTWSSRLYKRGFTVAAVRLRRQLVAHVINQGKSTYYPGAVSDLKKSLDYQATLKEGDGLSALSSPQDYLNQLYQQHKRKSSLWELIRSKLPAVTITASGVLYQAGKSVEGL